MAMPMVSQEYQQWNRHAFVIMLERMSVSCLVIDISTVRKPMHEQWSKFKEDIDDVIPLTVREIKCFMEDSKPDKVNEGCIWSESLSHTDQRKAQENALYNTWIDDSSQTRLLPVPRALGETVLAGCHDDS